MKFYVAAQNQEPARALRDLIVQAGHEVTSRWLEEKDYGSGAPKKSDQERREIALQDVEDVILADRLVLIANPPGENSPGGRHVETGIALYAGKPVCLIGRRENIFHWHPGVTKFEDVSQFIASLSSLPDLPATISTDSTKPVDGLTSEPTARGLMETFIRYGANYLLTDLYKLDASNKDHLLVAKIQPYVEQRDFDNFSLIMEQLAKDFGLRGAMVQHGIDLEARPWIVCLCGSSRFKDEFIRQQQIEANLGHIVLSLDFFSHADGAQVSEEQKAKFDTLHRDKILLADEILVINVNGYIGESTRAEIEFAKTKSKKIRYLQPT